MYFYKLKKSSVQKTVIQYIWLGTHAQSFVHYLNFTVFSNYDLNKCVNFTFNHRHTNIYTIITLSYKQTHTQQTYLSKYFVQSFCASMFEHECP